MIFREFSTGPAMLPPRGVPAPEVPPAYGLSGPQSLPQQVAPLREGARSHTRTPELISVPDNRPLASIEAVESGLATQGYIASRQIATAVYLSEQISKPILVEGPAGVGKTELAKA